MVIGEIHVPTLLIYIGHALCCRHLFPIRFRELDPLSRNILPSVALQEVSEKC
jgi:hypothetical protein